MTMKLGTQTASLTNHIYSRAVKGQPAPEVGMGATMLAWTDRYAGTIIEIFNIGKSVCLVVQEDHAKRIDKNGLSECQQYAYSANPNGAKRTFRQSNDGTWKEGYVNAVTKRWRTVGGYGLRIGDRQQYRDFTF